MTKLHMPDGDTEVIIFLISTAGFRCWEAEFYLPLPSVSCVNWLSAPPLLFRVQFVSLLHSNPSEIVFSIAQILFTCVIFSGLFE